MRRPPSHVQSWRRRAQPLLGTLVEIGVALECQPDTGDAAADAAFAVVREVQACLSRFEPGSDIVRFHGLRRGEWLTMHPATQAVLAAAQWLHDSSDGAFDVSLGSAPQGWRCDGDRLQKLDAAAHLDLGGIGKGYAVDRAVQVLLDQGCKAGWVNAGGDLRAFGELDLPVQLRDEHAGGVRPWIAVKDAALATSHFDPTSRSKLVSNSSTERPERTHVSVAAPLCLWADALTKLVALSGDTSHPLLARFEARAWLH